MGDYNSIEKISPRWRSKWKRPLIQLGRSVGIIIPKPMLTCLGTKKGKYVHVGWVIDEKTGKDMVIIDFEWFYGNFGGVRKNEIH